MGLEEEADKAVLDEYVRQVKEVRRLEVENADLRNKLKEVQEYCLGIVTNTTYRGEEVFVASAVINIIGEEE